MKAQLSSNPDKFLGNITTSYNVDYGNEKYYTLWNQITCENESKWGSIEGTNNQFNWGGSDNAYNYAKSHNFPFKFHALVWGAQYPKWLESQTPEQRYKEIVQWMDAVKKRYPDLQLIDVVNEAITGHQAGTPYFIEALGGTGKSGYDWLIEAFRLAYERWPNAILIYNDFNTFQWNTDQYIDIVKTLRDAGAPIDAYGCQSHDLTDCSLSTFKASMTKLQSTLQMPMYSTEYDIGTSDDALQKQRYQEQIPYMWEADYVAGITLWGYIYGKTWTTDGNSGLIKNGQDRPAMTWLREYMKSDAAKNAKSPFPGMKKEASIYIQPSTIKATQGDTLTVNIQAAMRTKSIERVDLYVKGALYQSYTEAPYVAKIICSQLGRTDLKAIVTTTDGETYTRVGGYTVYQARSPYKSMSLPGTIQVEDFDKGADGIAYHDSDSKNEGVSYRTDGTGVDIVTGNNGYAIGYTAVGEWLEYTVDVKEAGLYEYKALASSGTTGSAFQLGWSSDSGVKNLSNNIEVPQTGSGNWDKYVAVFGRTLMELPEGRHTLRLSITGANCNIDKIVFEHIVVDNNMKCTLSASPSPATVNAATTIKATASSTTSEIQNVKFYVGGQLKATKTEAPFEYDYTPTAKGEVVITAVATDKEGRKSKEAKLTLKVNNQRTPYKTISVPGTFQAEDFDKGGEGLTFHDSDSENSGDVTNYRTDNEGVDLVKGNNGTVIGYTNANEWLEYTVNVTQAGKYTYTATVSSGVTGSGFKIGLVKNGSVTNLANVSVPQTGNNDWGTYKAVSGSFSAELPAGKQILRITITGANCNIDKIQLQCTSTGIEQIEKEENQDTTLYNIIGQRVNDDYRGIVLMNGKKVIKR